MISFRFVSFLSLHILFRFVSQFTDFVSFRRISFRFVSLCFGFVVFRFVSLCFVSVSFLTLQGPELNTHKQIKIVILSWAWIRKINRKWYVYIVWYRNSSYKGNIQIKVMIGLENILDYLKRKYYAHLQLNEQKGRIGYQHKSK